MTNKYLNEKKESDRKLRVYIDNQIIFGHNTNTEIAIKKSNLNSSITTINANMVKDNLLSEEISDMKQLKKHYMFFEESYSLLMNQWKRECNEWNEYIDTKYSNPGTTTFQDEYEDLISYKMLLSIHNSLHNYIKEFDKLLDNYNEENNEKRSNNWNTIDKLKIHLNPKLEELVKSPFIESKSNIITINESFKSFFEKEVFMIDYETIKAQCNKALENEITLEKFNECKEVKSLKKFIENSYENLIRSNKIIDKNPIGNYELKSLRRKLSPIYKLHKVYTKNCDVNTSVLNFNPKTVFNLNKKNQLEIIKEYIKDPLGLRMLKIMPS